MELSLHVFVCCCFDEEGSVASRKYKHLGKKRRFRTTTVSIPYSFLVENW